MNEKIKARGYTTKIMLLLSQTGLCVKHCGFHSIFSNTTYKDRLRDLILTLYVQSNITI